MKVVGTFCWIDAATRSGFNLVVMLDRIFKTLFNPNDRDSRSARDPRDAIAALLVEAARMNEVFDAEERVAVDRLLTERFHLDNVTVARLIEEAERETEDAVHLYRFTSAVAALTPEERVEVIEMMWEVALSDGELDPREDMLLRRVAGLIHVDDADRAAARRRVLDRRR